MPRFSLNVLNEVLNALCEFFETRQQWRGNLAAELAARTGKDIDVTARCLRACVEFGVLKVESVPRPRHSLRRGPVTQWTLLKPNAQFELSRWHYLQLK